MNRIERVAVVGAGTMGSQIALQIALSATYQISLVDVDGRLLEQAADRNQRLAARLVEKGRGGEADADEALGRIRPSASLARGVSDADLVIEAIFEQLGPKLDLFEQLGRLSPSNAILASNSSSIGISRLAGASGRPDRCCNMHFFHPVTVMKLCEVVKGPETSEDTVAAAMDFVRSIKRTPVLVRKEIHGFIVNRILFAAAEEAMHLLEGDYAGAEDIDIAVKKGLNWPMGPFELLDFSGLDIFLGAFQDRYELGEGEPPPAVLKQLVEAGHLGRKTGKGFFDY